MHRKIAFLVIILGACKCFAQQPTKPSLASRLDSLIGHYLDSIHVVPYSTVVKSIYTSQHGEGDFQSIADSARERLLQKYLNLFDSLFYKGDIYPERGSLSSPEQKIRYLIGYCLYTNVYPTRTFMEALLNRNARFLFEKVVSADCPVQNPFPVRIRRKDIKKAAKAFYRDFYTDKLTAMSENYIQQYKSHAQPSRLTGTASGSAERSVVNFEDDHFWKVEFCVVDTNGQRIDSAMTVTYHTYKQQKCTNVQPASYAFASLPPGELYLMVTRMNSEAPLKIKENIIVVRDLIRNAWEYPEHGVWKYDRNKALSRENTFIIHIQLIK